jgi:hypothetical protein
MGPWNEERQLARCESVLRLLERNDLSEWARNYWSGVYDTIARDEARYNARVVTLYTEIRKRAMKDWLL